MDSITNTYTTMLHDKFTYICLFGNINDIETYINKYIYDINYDDGYFTEIICSRNDINLLRLFIKHA